MAHKRILIAIIFHFYNTIRSYHTKAGEPVSASFDAYRTFYYVGKTMNITHAASALFLSQSTVSRGIQNLEAELGCRLFERNQHGVSFTPEGRVLFEHVSRGCESIFLGEERVRQMLQSTGSRIRIFCGGFLFSRYVLPAARVFGQEHPDIRFEFLSGGFDSYRAVADALTAGALELACVSVASPDELTGSGTELLPAATYEEVLLASARFPELREGSYALSDLRGYPFATLKSGTSAASHLDRLLRLGGISSPPPMAADSVGMFLTLLKEYPCLAPVPAPCMEEFTRDGAMFRVHLKSPLPSHSIVLLTARAASHGPMTDSFLHHLRRAIRRGPETSPTETR